jgi:2-aminoadipate transaminase
MTIDDRHPQGRRVGPGTHEVARYEGLFAQRTRGMRSSAMRDMMSLTERPEVISLAGGLPETGTFPPELYAQLMSHVAATETARALQYGPTEGLTAVVECIVQVMAEEQTAVDPDEVLVTTGGQQVIDLVCKALIDKDDVIVAEAPTYPGAIPSFGAYQANVVQIDIDSDGMPIDELERTLDALAADGKRPKFIYTIPNFQNPGGVTMSLPRRRRLVEVARERELLVLEDNPYGLLRYEGQPLPTLYCLDAALAGRGGASDFVIYLGTFSKILSPGVRLGWAVAPQPVLEKLNLGKQGADLCSSPVTQLFVAAYFREHDWRAYLNSLKALYATRRDAMLAALAQHFGPDAQWTTPTGGMFIWATLPDYIDTTDLLARALETEDVAFVPGRSAYLDGRGASSMRLNFAGVPEERIAEGVRRIGRVIAEQVGLFGTLTGRPQESAPARGTADAAAAAQGVAAEADPDLAKVLELPTRDAQPGKRRSR